MNCDALLKGTKVDGVYNADPAKDPTAVRYERLSFHQVLAEDLNVMDHAAISLARENHIPILVFSLNEIGSMAAVVQQQGMFTIVNDNGD
jgi:uridylate kinase